MARDNKASASARKPAATGSTGLMRRQPDEYTRLIKELETSREELQRQNEELLLAREDLMNILGSMEDGICIINRDLDVAYINPALEAQYGAVAGQKCFQYFLGRGDACPWCKIEKILGGEVRRKDTRSLRNGRMYEVTAIPFRNRDGSVSKLSIFHDVTERTRAELLKDEFFGMVSHELKTPLTVIIGALSVASEADLSPGQMRELIADASSSANDLAVILGNLLELSRYRANRLTVQSERSSVAGVATEVVRRLEAKSPIHQLNPDFPRDFPKLCSTPSALSSSS